MQRTTHFGQVRFLHKQHCDKKQVVIANNSGLFATLACIEEHRKLIASSAHNKLTVFIPPFWLDKIHSDYRSLDWGQTPLALPRYVREYFSRCYPDHDENTPIKWGQFIDFRASVVRALERLGVGVIQGIPVIKNDADHSFTFAVNDENELTLAGQFHVYNSFREPNVDHGIPELRESMYKRPHTDLYLSEKADIPGSVVLLGGGRSVIWAAQHFPDTQFACISEQHKDAEKLLLRDEEPPENLHFFLREDVQITGVDNGNGMINIERRVESDHSDDVLDYFQGKFFCAIGLKHDFGLTSILPEHTVTLYPNPDLFLIVQNDYEPVEPPNSMMQKKVTQEKAVAFIKQGASCKII